jgi:hypothetical protein
VNVSPRARFRPYGQSGCDAFHPSRAAAHDIVRPATRTTYTVESIAQWRAIPSPSFYSFMTRRLMTRRSLAGSIATALRLPVLTIAMTMLLGVTHPAWADRQQDPALGRFLQQTLKEGPCFEDEFEKKVWLAAMEPKLANLVKDEQERSEILHHVFCEARRLGLPPGLVMAVIDVESRFDRWAVSSAGAVGLMQVMPFWPNQLGMTNAELVRIPQNVRMGCTILKFYLEREKGDYTKALARYNGSVGRRNYADLVLTRLANRWQFR